MRTTASRVDCPVPCRLATSSWVAVSFTATIGSHSTPSAAICRSRSTPVVVSSQPARTPSRSSGRRCRTCTRSQPSSSSRCGRASSTASRCAAYPLLSTPCRACTPTPCSTRAAATSSCVDSGLDAARCSSAPPAVSVRASAAVSGVTCMQAATRTPASGRSWAKRRRSSPSTGMDRSAKSVRRRPCSASPGAATSCGSPGIPGLCHRAVRRRGAPVRWCGRSRRPGPGRGRARGTSTRARGSAARTRASASSIARATPGRSSAGAMATLAATSSSSGPRCIVLRWITRVTPTPVDERGADGHDRVLGGRLPEQQALHLDGEDGGDHEQQRADAERPDGVPPRLVGEDRQADAGQRQHQTEQRGEVLQQHDRQLRHLRVPHEAPPAVVALERAGLLDRCTEAEPLRGDGEHQDADRDARAGQLAPARAACGSPRTARTGRPR